MHRGGHSLFRTQVTKHTHTQMQAFIRKLRLSRKSIYFDTGDDEFLSMGVGETVALACASALVAPPEESPVQIAKKCVADPSLIHNGKDSYYPLEVSIPSIEEEGGVTHFIVQVTLHKDTGDDQENRITDVCWTVSRRYSIFLIFYEFLVRHGVSLKHMFPPKTLVTSISKGAVKKRQLQLEAVLREVVWQFNRSALTTKVVWQLFSFLDMPEEYAQTDGDWKLDSLSPVKSNPQVGPELVDVNNALFLFDVCSAAHCRDPHSEADSQTPTPTVRQPEMLPPRASSSDIQVCHRGSKFAPDGVIHSANHAKPVVSQGKATVGKTSKKKEMQGIRTQMGAAYRDCVEKTDFGNRQLGLLVLMNL
jgi:hypothetical protein